jgi:predicted ATP-dependent endonuclease of OLD family
MKGMKIIEFKAENFKRLKVVEFKPDGVVQIVGGDNAQGKTSVMDAIFSALAGATASKQIVKPIREGEDHAEVRLDLGDIIVTRTWQNGKSELKVESPLGASFNSPQKMLDELLGRLSFDPLDFTRLDAKKQVSALMDISGLGDELDRIASERAKFYEARTEIGRTVKAVEGSLSKYGDDEPDVKAVSISELLALRDVAKEQNMIRTSLLETEAELEAQIEKLQEKLSEVQERIKVEGSFTDLSTLDEQVANAEEINKQAERNQARGALKAELVSAQTEYHAHDVIIDELDVDKVRLLTDANLPIEGLGFTEEGVTYKGVAFAQCSSSEQIRVSLAMAMALNPTVRVIRILDGSLLDASSMEMVADMAADKGFQVWIERVGDADGVGVIIEDGEVKE